MNAGPAGPYEGVRIIELTGQLGSYCSRLFADLGAEVIRVEAPGGRADRRSEPRLPNGTSLPFEFLNINKKSIALDIDSDAGKRVLRDLIGAASVVLWQPGAEPGIDLPEILAVPGARVVTAISHFGLTGPYADFASCDLVDQALGGIAWLSGTADREPLRLAGRQSIFVASLYAAAATALALWDCERTGTGHVIDVSSQEASAHSLQNALQAWDLESHVSSRGGEGIRDATEHAFRCKDGYVFLAAPLALSASWTGLLAWMEEEDFDGHAQLQNPAWADRSTRATEPMKQTFRTLFERFVVDRTKAELAAEALRRKIVMAPVSTVADLPQDPQLLFRGFFQTLPAPSFGRDITVPGAPYQLSEPIWQLRRAAPQPGEDTDAILEPGAGHLRRAAS